MDDTRRRPEVHGSMLPDEKCVMNHIIQRRIRRSAPPTPAHQAVWNGVDEG
jgi:hypothetical protein